jgi:hypothetical protein
MLLKFQIPLLITAVLFIGAFGVYHTDAEAQEVKPEVVDYHLELAEGILETCYTRDTATGSLILNPTLTLISDLAGFCEDKMQSLADYLAEFVDDEDGKMYAEHIATKTKTIESETMASKVEP